MPPEAFFPWKKVVFFVCIIFSLVGCFYLKDCFVFVTKDNKMSLLEKELLEKNVPKFYQRPDFFLLISKDKKTIWITSNFLYTSFLDFCLKPEDQKEFFCFKEKYQNRFMAIPLDNALEENIYHITLKSFDEEKNWLKKILGFFSTFNEKKYIYIGSDKKSFEEKKQKIIKEKEEEVKIIINKKQEITSTLKLLLSSLRQDYENMFQSLPFAKSRETFLSLYGKKYSPIFTQLLTSLQAQIEYEQIINIIQSIGLEVIKNYDNLKKDERNKINLKDTMLNFFKKTEKALEEL